MIRYVNGPFKKKSFQFFWFTNLNQNPVQSKNKRWVLLYYIYHKYTNYSLNLIFKISNFQIISNIINFVKIKISSANNKVKPKSKCNTFCKCIFYAIVMKLPKLLPLQCPFTHLTCLIDPNIDNNHFILQFSHNELPSLPLKIKKIYKITKYKWFKFFQFNFELFFLIVDVYT